MFTAVDDDSVGERIENIPGIANSSGSPINTYGTHQLLVGWNNATPAVIKHCKFKHGYNAINSQTRPTTIRSCQFIQCFFGTWFLNSATDTENCLFTYNPALPGPVGGARVICIAEDFTRRIHNLSHCTAYDHTYLTQDDTITLPNNRPPGPGQIRGWNNLWIKVANYSPDTPAMQHYQPQAGDFYSATDPGGVFQTEWLGRYYLPQDSPHRNVCSSAGLSAELVSELRQRTTTAPQRLSAITQDTILGRRGLQDNGPLDRGYHYPTIDYLANYLEVNPYKTLTLNNGVSIGAYSDGFGQ